MRWSKTIQCQKPAYLDVILDAGARRQVWVSSLDTSCESRRCSLISNCGSYCPLDTGLPAPRRTLSSQFTTPKPSKPYLPIGSRLHDATAQHPLWLVMPGYLLPRNSRLLLDPSTFRAFYDSRNRFTLSLFFSNPEHLSSRPWLNTQGLRSGFIRELAELKAISTLCVQLILFSSPARIV